uniref:Beta-1,4-glucuronyltransferase 1 n=1 Tax=Hirondellea gigas TaxID=1518452 RepID=A0A6A7G5F3_9CRUS
MLLACRVWALSAAGIVTLTLGNIFLTMQVLNGKEELLACGGFSSPKAWTAAMQEGNLTNYLAILREANIVTDDMLCNNKVVCKGVSTRNSTSSSSDTEYMKKSSQAAFMIDDQLGRWDNHRLYKTYDHVYTGPNYRTLSSSAVVCLATQTSVDRLYWLIQAARHWSEPVSIAVFTPDIEYGIARIYFQYLMACFPLIGDRVTVHFTYPKEHPPLQLQLNIQDLLKLCDKPVTVLRELLHHRDYKMMAWRERMAYPQNVLRNVARKNCNTEWVFLIDVDIVAIPNFSRQLNDFLRTSTARGCAKCAFVIPTYEVDEKAQMPRNVTALLQLVRSNKARPFHQKVFVHNQYATNFSLWQSQHNRSATDTVTVSHKVTNFEFFYEPFYVSRDSAPPHDERFVGYGFTRNTQVYEMFVSGYEFFVLSPLFTLHWGMQVKKSRPQWRETQNNKNRKRFEGFKKEILGRYQKDPLGMMKPKRKIIKKSWKNKS